MYVTRLGINPLQSFLDFSVVENASEELIQILYCPENTPNAELDNMLQIMEKLVEVHRQQRVEGGNDGGDDEARMRRFIQGVIILIVEEEVMRFTHNNDDGDGGEDHMVRWKANVRFIMKLLNGTNQFGSQYHI